MRLCGTGTSSNKEDDYRAAYPSWMDKVASDIRTQWQKARANRRMQFKVGDYKDSKVFSRTSYIEARCTGVFKIKVLLPGPSLGPRSCRSRCSFPMTCRWMSGTQESTPCPLWPDVSMLGASNLRRVVGYDFHHIRKKYDVPSMWGNILLRGVFGVPHRISYGSYASQLPP